MNESVGGVTVVVVHAAWEDGSSWSEVIRALHANGVKVIAAPLPLTTLSDDIEGLDRVLERTQGPIVLVSHAYSGAVVSGTQNDRVRALVHVAGLTPAEGETVLEVFTREKPHPKAPQIAPDPHGIIWLPDEAFAAAFAQNAAPHEVEVLKATQRPISLKCIQERSPVPLWTRKPSWYLICEDDRMIPQAVQRYLAERMGAKIRAAKVDHVPLVTAPELVVDMIQEAISHTK